MNPEAPAPASRRFGRSSEAPNFPSPQNSIAPIPPLVIPDHELIRLIGHGSYGQVWLAKNAVGTLRAVKVVYRATFEKEAHFEREFKGLQKFEPISRSHDGYVDILQLGRNDPAGYFYYVMELADDAEPKPNDETRNPTRCDGATARREEARNPNDETGTPIAALRTSDLGCPSSFDIRHSDFYTPLTLRDDLKHRGALPIGECFAIGAKLASALEHLHAQDLVHRDIKPSNIIFVNGEPKLADIGLVTNIDDAQSMVGTAGYIPPEGPGAAQADIYSLGKVLYEIAFGKDRQEFPQLPPDLQAHPDHASLLELNEILLKACAVDPRQRYVNAAAMLADLDRLCGGKSVRRAHQGERRWRLIRRGAGWVAVAAVALTLIALASRVRRPSVELGRGDEGPPSTNNEANMLYNHAIGITRGDDYQKLGEAYTNFDEATRLDPNFAKAYAALFEMHVRQTFFGMPPGEPDQIRKLGAKLAELAPSSSATHVARACMQYMDWQWDEARKSWEEAIRLNPRNEFAHTSYGCTLDKFGDSSNALKHLKAAAELEPGKAKIREFLGDPYYLRREYTNAIAQYKEGLRFTPTNYNSNAHYRMGRALRAMGRYPEAIDEFEKAELIDGADAAETKKSFNQLRDAFKKDGEAGYWREELRRTESEPDSKFYWKAVCHVHLGNTKEVFHWLNKSLETRELLHPGYWMHQMDYLLFDECWDSLREDPRYKELVRKVGFPGK